MIKQHGTLMTNILRLLNEGGIHSMAELARRLEVSEALVTAMTEDLTRRGYLTALSMGCTTACAKCPLAGVCATPSRPTNARTFALATKGRAAVN